jgi:type IV secretion system protein VirB10
MTTRRALRFHLLGTLILAWGLAIPSAAQDAGPLPPAPASSDTQTAPAQNTPPATPAAAPAASAQQNAPARVEVPSGTHIPLVLHNGISTRSAQPGDPIYCETLFPIMVDGHVVIPAGSYLSGEVTESKRAGRVKGRAEIAIKFTTLILPNAYEVNLIGTPGGTPGTGGGESTDNEGKIKGDTSKASDAGTVLTTTTAGAGIGGVASQSGKGAGIGAGVGAAAGLAAVLLSRGPEAELPRGSTIDAVLSRPLFLDADKVQFTSPGQSSTIPGPPDRGPQRSRIPF